MIQGFRGFEPPANVPFARGIEGDTLHTVYDETAKEHIYTISELNRSARETLEETFGEVWVKGEISELKRAASGHLYFTLRDADSEISAVRFRSHASVLSGVPIEQGMTILAFGKLTVYEPRGRYQFVASILQPIGAGALQAAIERLKARLLEEGLFDPAHKVPLPPFPRRIGVVTSPSGAAFRDIRATLTRRWPLADLFLFPTSVQGESAPTEIVDAVEAAVRFSEAEEPLDVLIVGRGGGSAEDLAAFSDEQVVRTIYGCPIPVVSAVGHEVDSALSDFAADLRAPTPASAAELVAPDVQDLIRTIEALASRAGRSISSRLTIRSERLRANLRGYLFRIPGRKIETISQRLDVAVEALRAGMARSLTERVRRWEHAADVLRLADPNLPLRRGYSLTFLKGTTTPLRAASEISEGSRIETRLATGRLHSRVEEVIDE